MHDLLEARHHLIACNDIEQAGTVTEHVCLQLDTWGAWDHEATLIHDTLAHLSPDSPRRSAWIHTLGNVAYRRGDYEQAERRYQQSLQIKERLDNQASMATSWSQLGNLATERQQYAEAVGWHLRAFIMRMNLQVPQVANNVRALIALREQMGDGAFTETASTVLDDTKLAQVQALLDSGRDAGQDESER